LRRGSSFDVRDESIPTEKFYNRLEEITHKKDKKAERETAEKAAREKSEKEATETKARLEVEDHARDKNGRNTTETVAQEKADHEEKQISIERGAQPHYSEKDFREKVEHDTNKNASTENNQEVMREKIKSKRQWRIISPQDALGIIVIFVVGGIAIGIIMLVASLPVDDYDLPTPISITQSLDSGSTSTIEHSLPKQYPLRSRLKP